MALEIERRFLVADDAWRHAVVRSNSIIQGYLAPGPTTVRVRVSGEQAWLTVKGPASGLCRHEFEYPIPLPDAHAMLTHLCEQRIIKKTRHIVPHAGHHWEVDEFSGRHQGLLIAELELSSANETFDVPAWLGAEISGDPRFSNSALALAAETPVSPTPPASAN